MTSSAWRVPITGEALIGGASVKGALGPFRAGDPARAEPPGPAFHTLDARQVHRACQLAKSAFDAYRASDDRSRASLLEAIAGHLDALGEPLIECAQAESGLPRSWLEGERHRVTQQLRLFAALLRDGAWRDRRDEVALAVPHEAARAPSHRRARAAARPEMRVRLIGLGPVAVCASGDFALAFAVAGADTASALAAGCPVVVQAHPAHPGTSEMVGRAIQQAVAQCALPAGVFALLTGAGNTLGQQLVQHPAICAVGFTGSRDGAMALLASAAARPQPIPVFTEMSSINPVLLLPRALAARGAGLGAEFASALTLGGGQFCTSPGIVLGIQGRLFGEFCDAAAAALEHVPPAPMLTPDSNAAYRSAVDALARHEHVLCVSYAAQPATPGHAHPGLFATTGTLFLADPSLSVEIFGPAALLVSCRDIWQLREVMEHLQGQLTATLLMDDGDLEYARMLLPVLERKVGRILVNTFPAGTDRPPATQELAPALPDAGGLLAGAAAISRFLRPVAYQNLPPALLPTPLREGNSALKWRRVAEDCKKK